MSSTPPLDSDAPRDSSVRALANWVLVVDDDQPLCRSVARHLRSWGHEARIAHTAHAALQLCDEHMPAVALVDIMMPGMNGYQLSKRLVVRADAPAIILISASFKEEEHHPGAGVVACLPKPIHFERLRGLVDSIMMKRAAAGSDAP